MPYEIRKAELNKERQELNTLLWEVLWKPLDFPPDIRKEFELDYPQIELIAIDNQTQEFIGGLVANRISDKTLEIRHLAVRTDRRGKSVGTTLVEKLLEFGRQEAIVKIQTHARNTSIGFFHRLGFKSTGKQLQHPEFSRHGITFQLVEMRVTEK
jgi:N-acetylglutamate synthase-like GNAT family acetyltransferase